MSARLPVPQAGSLTEASLDWIIVDGSGSMWNKWQDSMSLLDQYVGGVKAARLSTRIVVQLFQEGRSDLIERDHSIADWVPFSEDPLSSPSGGSPLFDAINIMGRSLRDLNPSKCSICIVTDGMANGNHFTDETQARAILEWCRGMGWSVTFIGCDFNNSAQARALGATEAQCIGVQKSRLGEAGKLLADKRKKYQNGDDMEFSDSEKQQFGGYLAAPGK